MNKKYLIAFGIIFLLSLVIVSSQFSNRISKDITLDRTNKQALDRLGLESYSLPDIECSDNDCKPICISVVTDEVDRIQSIPYIENNTLKWRNETHYKIINPCYKPSANYNSSQLEEQQKAWEGNVTLSLAEYQLERESQTDYNTKLYGGERNIK